MAGPPFVTDDPEPVDLHRFEINVAAQQTWVREAHGGALPTVDINYGLLPETQFHVGLSGAFERKAGGSADYGYGDTEFGLKYRFVTEDDEGWRPQVAAYPSIDLPTGDAREGLGSGHKRIFVPLWLQKSVGDWQTYGGGGYWLNQSDQTRNYWFAGWTLLRRFTDRWTLGGEVFHQSADLVGAAPGYGDGISTHSSTAFNLGGYYRLQEDRNILFTVGRGLHNSAGTDQFSFYLGCQFVL